MNFAYCSEEDDEDEDYEPVQSQFIQVLNDENFEEITHMCKFKFVKDSNPEWIRNLVHLFHKKRRGF